MIKKELLSLRTLNATPKMMEMAIKDTLESREYKSPWGSTYRYKAYEYCLFMRCQTLKGYLKVSFFLPQMMRYGSNKSAYDLYIHKDARQYLTFGHREQKWLTAMADNLDWGFYLWKGKAWINPEGNRTIQTYLGVDKGGIEGIIQYQRKVKSENLEAKYRRQTDRWDADLKLTPQLPRDWKSWCSKEAIPEQYILYDYVRAGAKSGYCTYCEKEVPISKPGHNKKGICPVCGREITYKSKGKQKYLQTKVYYAYLLQRVKTGFVVREFQVKKTYRQDKGWGVTVWDHEIRRAFFDQNAKQTRSYMWDLFRGREHRFCGTDNCSYSWGGRDAGAVYARTIPDLAKKELVSTGLREYLQNNRRVDAEWYLAVWNKHPHIEELVKAELPELVGDCLRNITILNEIYNRQLSGGLAKRMHLDEGRLKRLRSNRGGYRFWQWLRYEKKRGTQFPDELISWFVAAELAPSSISFIRDRMTEIQICNYLKKQMEVSNIHIRTALTTWKDTLDMAIKYKLDIQDPYHYRPAKLKQRHDELVLRGAMEDLKQQAEKTKKDFPKVEPILQEIRDIYCFTGEKYLVAVPETILDIMVEGKNLQHCIVKSTRYLDRIERRESYILFLRRAEAPGQSYYTLEVEPDGTVRQKRSMNDEQYPDIEDATAFLRQWQKEVSKRLTETERNLAKKSKQLRLEGFQQMRRDRLIIHTGALQGKLLVDVLMADLMENNEEEKTA